MKTLSWFSVLALVACADALAPAAQVQVPAVYTLVEINGLAMPVPAFSAGTLVLWDDSTFTDAMQYPDGTWDAVRGRFAIVGDSLHLYPNPSAGIPATAARITPDSVRLLYRNASRLFARP